MKDNFDLYVENLVQRRERLQAETTEGSFPFTDWPFDRFRQEFKRWQPDTRRNYLWVIVKGYNKRTHTKVGTSSDLRACLLENSKKLQCGGGGGGSGRRNTHLPPPTPEAAATLGLCKMAMYVGLPPVRNYSALSLDRSCTKGRGWVSRCNNALVLALLHGLETSISEELLDERSPLYIQELAQSVESFRPPPPVVL